MKKIICCAVVSAAILLSAGGCKKQTQENQTGGAAGPAAPLPAMAVLTIAPDGGLSLDGRAVKIDSLEAELGKLVKASPGGLKVEISFVKADANTFSQLEPVVQACMKAKVVRATVGKYPYGAAPDAKPPTPVSQGILPIRIAKKEDIDNIAQTVKAQLSGKVVAVKCSPTTKIPLLSAAVKMIVTSEGNFTFQPSDPAVGDAVEIHPAQ
ncbi:MAG: hypothetical protein HZA50_05490 [Planctomycetes bacterium]|nr:hypothetical protein [Planctomycetota bacterium]